MNRKKGLFVGFLAAVLGAGTALLQTRIPQSRPDQMVPIAPNVYFRHGDLDTPQKSHCNNGVVVFKEFVLIVDANFPSGAAAVIEDIKKAGITKPVRFVFDTHHHGDHAYGNRWFMNMGVIPIAHQGVVDELKRYEPTRWQQSAKGRPDVAELKQETALPPILTFPDKMVLDDGEMRVEFYHFGTGHTRGDGFAYLPKQKILFTGDACVNGPYNYMGDGNSQSWLDVLSAAQQLDVAIVAPGHGPCSGKEVLEQQKQFFLTLREHVATGLRANKTVDEIKQAAAVPQNLSKYKGNFFQSQVEKVYKEMAGLEMPFELERLAIQEGPSPTKNSSGWTAPRKVVFQTFTDRVAAMQRVAPNVQLVSLNGSEDPLKEMAEADGLVGAPNREMIKAAKKLRWVQTRSAGVETYIGIGQPATPGIPELVNNPGIVLTNARRTYGPQISDHVFAYLLNFTRQMRHPILAKNQLEQGQVLAKPFWRAVDPGNDAPKLELRNKTMLVNGVGGIGSQVAFKAKAFGMRVIGIDPMNQRPAGVDELYPPAELDNQLPRADVVVNCTPLTPETYHRFNDARFDRMKNGVFFINIARGRSVDTEALMRALKSGKLAGVGLDVTDPEPLPDDHPLWKMGNVIITPHVSGGSDGRDERIFQLVRENLRRFVNGEPLLNVVDKTKGY